MAKTNWQMGDTVQPVDMNDIGQEINDLRNEIENIQPASLTEAGVVKLNNAINSTSDTDAATPSAVKQAYDKANAAETPAGAQAKANAAESNAKGYVDAKIWQKHRVTNDNGLVLNISNQNLNNLLVSGFYAGENITNAPTTAVGAWWYIEVIAMSGSHVKQIAMELFNNTYQQRTNNGSGWSAWSPDLFTSVANGKQAIATAISDKGVAASGSDEFAVLASKISQIKTGVKIAQASLGGIQSGTIANLPFTPKVVLIRTTLHAPNADAHGYVGAYLDSSIVKYLADLSVTGSASAATQLRNVRFESNSVYFEFNTPNTNSGAEGYVVFGE